MTSSEPSPVVSTPRPPLPPRMAAPAPLRSVGVLEIDERPSDDGNISFTLRGKYFVEGRLSPNRKYLVGACDGHEENGRTKSGTVILLDPRTGRELFRSTVKRANNPHVSDDGLVTVENWKDWGGSLAGAVLAFDSMGTKLWERSFKANICSSGMAEDGQTVFISTCASDHEAHSGKTWLLHATTGEPIWARQGFGNVRFMGNRLMIGLTGDRHTADNRFFPLDELGREPPEYLDALAEYQAQINRGKPWWAFPMVQEALEQPEPPLEKVEVMLLEVEKGGHPLSDNDRARIARWRGEIAERRGNLVDALRYWEQALALDPKVGIKRRYEALRKQIS